VWTRTLRGGARVAVVAAAQWCDAFGVVTRRRVQLELRDGQPRSAPIGSWPTVNVDGRGIATSPLVDARVVRGGGLILGR
jgi:hypothetical protein